MPVRYTSRLALLAELERLPKARNKVYTSVMFWSGDKGPTIEDIARETGMKESSVCGRVNELKEVGLLVEGPLKTNRTGKQAMTYVAMAYAEEMQLYHMAKKSPQLSLF